MAMTAVDNKIPESYPIHDQIEDCEKSIQEYWDNNPEIKHLVEQKKAQAIADELLATRILTIIYWQMILELFMIQNCEELNYALRSARAIKLSIKKTYICKHQLFHGLNPITENQIMLQLMKNAVYVEI